MQGSSAQAAAAAAAAAGRGKKRSFSQVAGELGSAHFHFFFIFFMSMETLVPVLRAGSPFGIGEDNEGHMGGAVFICSSSEAEDLRTKGFPFFFGDEIPASPATSITRAQDPTPPHIPL